MDALPPPDQELVLLARGGDAAAFDLIVSRHWEAVWRYACSMLRGTTAAAAVAEEITQDTFLKGSPEPRLSQGPVVLEGMALHHLPSLLRPWTLPIPR